MIFKRDISQETNLSRTILSNQLEILHNLRYPLLI